MTETQLATPRTRREARRSEADVPAGPARSTAGGARRAVRGAQRLVLNLAAVLGVVSIVVSVSFLAMNIRPAVVISGSMAPDIPVGALTVARTVPAETVTVGDVVTVPRTNADGLVTHRVIEAGPAEDGRATVLRLQGDANDEPDALPYVVTDVGKVLTSVPGAGYVVQFGQRNLVGVVAVLLLITAFATMPLGHAQNERESRPGRGARRAR